MQSQFKRLEVEAAKKDLENRTLMPIGYDFARIVICLRSGISARENIITPVWRVLFQNRRPARR